MSNLISSIVVGLGVTVSASSFVAVVGPYWPGSPTARAGQQDFGTPADPAPADGSAEAPPTSPIPLDEGDSPAPSRTVLLMKADGNVKVFDGPATEDRLDYILTLDIGQIRIPKAQVEERFHSLLEAYEYQRDHLPDRDPDEHLRLARWCLTHDMPGEAAEQLRALLAWSPGDQTAEAMLRNIELATARQTARDTGVVRAGTDAARGGGNAPRDLDDSFLRQMRNFKGRVPAPVIFDLDETLAVRRFQEYGQTVHRVLQIRCASCHDETTDRNFRLIRARDKKDLANAMLVRTNLDGTLALIDRSNPVYSPLLVNSVMPHGPDQKAIMHPNSPEYRAIWNWVESLRGDSNGAGNVAASGAVDPAFSPAAAPTGYPQQQPQGYPGTGYAPQATADPSFGGGFATQRPGPGVPGPAAIPSPNAMPMGGGAAPTAPIGTPGNPHVQRFENAASHPSVPDDLDFQTVSPLFGSADESASLLRIDGQIQGQSIAPAPMPPGAIPSPVPGGVPAPVPVPVPGNGSIPNPAPAPGSLPGPQAANPGVAAPPGFVMPPGASFPGAPAPAPASPDGRRRAPAPGPIGAPVPGVPPGSAPAPAPGPAPVLNPADGETILQTLDDGSQIVRQADGSKMLRLTDGEMIPYMDNSAIDNAPASGKSGSSVQIDPALLEKLQRGKMGNP